MRSRSTFKAADGKATGVPAISSEPESPPRPGALHGVRSAEVVAGPQLCGLASGARGPPLSFNCSSSNGCWGCVGERRLQLARDRIQGRRAVQLDDQPRTRVPRPAGTVGPACRLCRIIRSYVHGEHSGSPTNSSPCSGAPGSGGGVDGSGETTSAALSAITAPPAFVARHLALDRPCLRLRRRACIHLPSHRRSLRHPAATDT